MAYVATHHQLSLVTKSRWMIWVGYVERTGEMINAIKIVVEQPEKT
jgi:hypothetical protein